MNSQEFDIAKLEKRIELMQDLLTQMIATAAYRSAEVEALTEDNERLNRDVKHAKERADILATTAKEYHKEIRKLEEEIHSLKDARGTELNDKIDELTKELAEARQAGRGWLKPGTIIQEEGEYILYDRMKKGADIFTTVSSVHIAAGYKLRSSWAFRISAEMMELAE